jgi:hypothetical protein
MHQGGRVQQFHRSGQSIEFLPITNRIKTGGQQGEHGPQPLAARAHQVIYHGLQIGVTRRDAGAHFVFNARHIIGDEVE